MTVCYDERGSKYELPNYVLSDPQNLVRSGSGSGAKPTHAPPQVELTSAAQA